MSLPAIHISCFRALGKKELVKPRCYCQQRYWNQWLTCNGHILAKAAFDCVHKWIQNNWNTEISVGPESITFTMNSFIIYFKQFGSSCLNTAKWNQTQEVSNSSKMYMKSEVGTVLTQFWLVISQAIIPWKWWGETSPFKFNKLLERLNNVSSTPLSTSLSLS